MRNSFHSAGKLLSNEEMQLVEMLRTADRQTIFVPVTKKIAWVEETESTVELFYKERMIKKYTTFNDFYGYDSSRKEAIREAQTIIENLAIEPNSGLSLRVRQTITQRPCFLQEPPTSIKKLKATDIDTQYFINDETALIELKSIVEAPWSEDTHDRNVKVRDQIQISTKTIVQDKVVWDSLNGDVK